MILTREQIDATYPGPLRDTALSYHDLRDAVVEACLSQNVRLDLRGVGWVKASDIREVVARVERGDSG